jgi:hypothetical protein
MLYKKIAFTIVSLLLIHFVNAQQNLFNIPSGDLTPKNKVFYQQQININAVSQYAAKSHFVYGLGKGWEIGFNALNMNWDFTKSPVFRTSAPPAQATPFYPVGVITSQKQWNLNDHLGINIGTQLGVNLSESISKKRATHFSYLLGKYQLLHGVKIIGGTYLTDERMVGTGNTMGILAGTEVHINKKWLFMADFVSGNNKNGVSVFGFTYNVNPRFQLCAGWQLPNLNNRAETPALVLELNLFNF